MKRSAAYTWLAQKMNLPEEKAHIGMFDDAQCRQAIALVEREFRPSSRFDLMDDFNEV